MKQIGSQAISFTAENRQQNIVTVGWVAAIMFQSSVNSELGLLGLKGLVLLSVVPFGEGGRL
jgi:hypothetical protein